jgi:hypothetical protein
VEVPAGKFKAIRVVTESQALARPFRRTDWHAPGVGVVKRVVLDGKIESVEVLKSMTPGGKK